MLINATEDLGDFGDDFGDLGWGWRSIGRAFKKVGKGVYKVGKTGFNIAKMPVSMAKKVANAASGLLCKGGPVASAAGNVPMASAFCKAVKVGDMISIRKLLPAATKLASKVAGKSAVGNLAVAVAKQQSGLSDTDMGLLASLEGADPEALTFALSAVDPSEIGAAVTKSEALAAAPAVIATALGVFLISRR